LIQLKYIKKACVSGRAFVVPLQTILSWNGTVVSGWRAVSPAHNVPQKDADNIGRDISHRLKKINLRHLFEINDNRT